MLLRIAPFVVGLVAVRVWLRRREAGRRALAAAREAPRIEAGPTQDPLRSDPSKGFERAPIDIVTVVDDLLRAGR
jgi:hypothetical protein